MPLVVERRGYRVRGLALLRPARAAGNGQARIDEREEQMSDTDFGGRQLGAFGAGMALGLVIGVSVALLSAPRSGEQTRDLLRRQARRLGNRVNDQVDDFRHDLRRSARRSARTFRRGLTRGRRIVEGATDRYAR